MQTKTEKDNPRKNWDQEIRDKNQSKTNKKILISSERKEKKFQPWNKERVLKKEL